MEHYTLHITYTDGTQETLDAPSNIFDASDFAKDVFSRLGVVGVVIHRDGAAMDEMALGKPADYRAVGPRESHRALVTLRPAPVITLTDAYTGIVPGLRPHAAENAYQRVRTAVAMLALREDLSMDERALIAALEAAVVAPPLASIVDAEGATISNAITNAMTFVKPAPKAGGAT